MCIFQARIAALPKTELGRVQWRTMSKDDIGAAYAAAVAEGDYRLAGLASAALQRAFLREIKENKWTPRWSNGEEYFGPMLDDEGSA